MPKVKSRRIWESYFPENELRRREMGFNPVLGWESRMQKSIYTSMLPSTSLDPTGCVGHGGVFNLEFSPDGSHLVAACEHMAIMIFDPLSRRQIHQVSNAHNSCVNGIRFLDSRVFASCSDDQTVALWDVRNLKRRIRLLQGHSNWVKNIEYSAGDGMLVTSGFDGKILGWDINGYTEEGLHATELFSMQGLMRMRLTPDDSKLVICTTGGYLVIIHNLSLEHLPQDLLNFKPNMYRLMQVSNTPLPQAAEFTRLFNSKRNRVEFLSDFPAGNDAEVIHSLQVHPQGWCVLSRNTSMEDSSEWSCVHDIQDLQVSAYKEDDEDEHGEQDIFEELTPTTSQGTSQEGSHSYNLSVTSEGGGRSGISGSGGVGGNLHLSLTIQPTVEIMVTPNLHDDIDINADGGGNNGSGSSNNGNSGGGSGGSGSNRGNGDEGGIRESIAVGGGNGGFNIQVRFTSMDVFEALEHIRERRERQRTRQRDDDEDEDDDENSNMAGRRRSEISNNSSYSRNRLAFAASSLESTRNASFSMRSRREREGATNRDQGEEGGSLDSQRNAFFIRSGSGSHRAILLLHPGQNFPRNRRTVDPNHKIAKNIPRLTHFIEEPNVGRGFIKELCFSADGRLICSPYTNGVRLMMFDEHCSELSNCVQSSPQRLYDASTSICHSNCVVSTKFSPTHCLLVSGCLSGKIVWHQPVL
ncbi:DDB1- and CUL4-associated factor 10 homolog [Oratosquilla oratoria]|uniref:DDB1- and CUL4-associated factor 10 homolog n=1 Tax=Oratosquilla oratoria TaxID=337810 RepID=UPI003F75862D